MEKGRKATAIHVLEHLMHAPFTSEFDGHFAMIARTLIQLYLKEDTYVLFIILNFVRY